MSRASWRIRRILPATCAPSWKARGRRCPSGWSRSHMPPTPHDAPRNADLPAPTGSPYAAFHEGAGIPDRIRVLIKPGGGHPGDAQEPLATRDRLGQAAQAIRPRPLAMSSGSSRQAPPRAASHTGYPRTLQTALQVKTWVFKILIQINISPHETLQSANMWRRTHVASYTFRLQTDCGFTDGLRSRITGALSGLCSWVDVAREVRRVYEG